MDYRKAGGALFDAECTWTVVAAVSAAFRCGFEATRLPLQRFDMRTAVALGSNLGDRLENLRIARRQIPEVDGVGPPILCSGVYQTDPVNCEPGASQFLNAVIEFDYDGDPGQLLEQMARIEESLGRKRDHQKNVSRTIDIDVLYSGDRQIDNERLQLPHPRMHLRRFVLQPLTDIRPDLILPNQRKTIQELLNESGEHGAVTQFMDNW